MVKQNTGFTIETNLIEEMDVIVATGKYSSRSHFVEQAIKEKLKKEDDTNGGKSN